MRAGFSGSGRIKLCTGAKGDLATYPFLLPAGEPESLPDLPGEVEFLTDLSDKQRLGEEITLATLDQIRYEPDRWV